ncbi:polyphosphate kinase 1 [endosymbiont of unidentified scaly snail isolate Monju]|uniref:polyphosphate kinase 1 n=1 Tax=endosymbiont of unidentified scaly snail isolate Monju TaxID=1248727 RepID=UPI0003892B1B|nr:polyphosphate kinase 1 [endosymbiont of unidentified scaly snail isolate Monju]BAN68655.1 polyphosphate kinase [endosymbiont of unidentified scaly snail isolate Monju]
MSESVVPRNEQSALQVDAESPACVHDLSDPSLYLNRELTWLAFNRRVLHEAEDERNPLLERLKFLAIVSSNLDEFFMKRIGGLKQQIGAGVTTRTVDGRTPREQIAECYAVVREQEAVQREVLHQLLEALREHDIAILGYDELRPEQVSWLRSYFHDNIFPLITPQAIDPAHPFPFISNLSLNLVVLVRFPGEEGKTSLARIKIPIGEDVPRFIRLPDSTHFVAIEDIVQHNLSMLLPEMEIVHCNQFRVTRNANTERNEEHADDLLSLIESELRERRFAPIVRLQIQDDMDDTTRGMLAAELGLDENADVFSAGGDMLAMRHLLQIAELDVPDLHYPPFQGVDHPEIRVASNIFHAIRKRGPFLLHHPYENFRSSVERFLKEAAYDPKVRAIKMTLYRTSSDTKVVDYLIQAARNGKQVAVVVELKASFDEAANIRWATRMEEAGIHVTYGVVGLKTHSKIVLVVRKDYNGLRRYLHMGTGNYHAGTARVYSDLGLLTNDHDMGVDATELFNYLTTGYTPERYYRKLLPAPKMLKAGLLERIARERELHKSGTPGLIQFKMNALEDADITRALYEAAREGVHVDLIVRDTCRLRPGVPGLSENVRVISVVGRFLEHARIYYFRNGGKEEYFTGSADCMKRNLESRVEVVAPVEAENLRRELREILDVQLSDYRNAWEMQPDGSYVQRQPRTPEEEKGCQERLIEMAQERVRQAKRYQMGRARRRVMGRNLR